MAADEIKLLVDVAEGRAQADTLFTNAQIVDVYDLGIGEQRIGLCTALRHVDQELDLVCRHAIPSPSGAGPPSRAGIPAEPCAGIPTEPCSARLWSMIPKTARNPLRGCSET